MEIHVKQRRLKNVRRGIQGGGMLCFLGFWWVLLLLQGCRQGSEQLVAALKCSGTNRAELEKILNHYAQDPADSLKWKSAVFLIENMPGHYTLDGDSIRRFKARIDTMKNLSPEAKRVLLTLPDERPDQFGITFRTEDITTITADHLIGHIESVFRLKDLCPWLSGINFEIFSEYLLPYRIGHEIPERSADTISPELKKQMDFAIRYYHDCQHSIHSIASYIEKSENFIFYSNLSDTLLKKYLQSPDHIHQMSLLRLRRLGIPATIDFKPVRRPGDNEPVWHNEIDPRTKIKTYYRILGQNSGKIYRSTFSRQSFLTADTGEYIPAFFLNPFQKEVTDIYMYTADIRFHLPVATHNRYAYLALHNGQEWQPIAIGEIKGQECRFTGMEKACVYLPVYYPDGKMTPLGDPFILNNQGKMIPLTKVPDTLQSVEIKRIRPYSGIYDYNQNYILESVIECADNINFTHADTAYTIRRSPYYNFETIQIDSTKKKRFWRIRKAYSWGDLSELHFVTRQEAEGRVIGPDTLNAYKLTDNNPATSKNVRQWIGMDFGKPVALSCIKYMTANDNNNIYTGKEYELFYDQQGKWISAGIQKATNHSVVFTGIPVHGLYVVKCKTDDKNGYIFTIEKGKVRFW